MNKLLLAILLAISFSVSADGHRHHDGHHWEHHGHGGYYNDNWWVAPAIIGGAAITYGLTRPAPAPYPYGYHPESIFDPYCNCYKTVMVPN